jgi:hypothetical protein
MATRRTVKMDFMVLVGGDYVWWWLEMLVRGTDEVD